MQNDTWLTDTLHPECCPLCSQPLIGGVKNCPACGFTVHVPARASASAIDKPAARRANPATPVPARASAQRSTGGSSRHAMRSLPPNSPATHSPERGWQHESPSYEAASSLSALSLIIAETPTAPPRTTRRLSGQTGDLEHIDEIDTVPQTSSESQSVQDNPAETPLPSSFAGDSLDAFPHILSASYLAPTLFAAFDEIDTLPEPGALATSAVLQSMPPETSEIPLDAASWSNDPDSTRARNSRLIARRGLRRFTLLDRVRWWLVRPGHIELLFRLVGAILLFALTFLLAFVVVLNLPLGGRGNFPTSAAPASAGVSTAQPTPILSSPTPTSSASPAATPTTSAIASVTAGTPEAAASQQSGPDSPVSVPGPSTANSLFAQLTHLNPLVWVVGLCYLLSLFLLIMAGILRRRR